MRVRISIVITQAVVVAAISACVGEAPPPEEQGAEYRAPRTADGQAGSERSLASAEHGATYDLEAHAARPAL